MKTSYLILTLAGVTTIGMLAVAQLNRPIPLESDAARNYDKVFRHIYNFREGRGFAFVDPKSGKPIQVLSPPDYPVVIVTEEDGFPKSEYRANIKYGWRSGDINLSQVRIFDKDIRVEVKPDGIYGAYAGKINGTDIEAWERYRQEHVRLLQEAADFVDREIKVNPNKEKTLANIVNSK